MGKDSKGVERMKNILYLIAIICVFLMVGVAGGVEAGSIGAVGFIVRLAILAPIGLGCVCIAKKM